MELESSLDKFEQQRLGIAAISYDGQELLHHFAQRMGGFSYPLLSDPDSSIIEAFGLLNENIPEDHEWYGICFPGTFIVDENGVVRSKYFEPMHRQRFTTDTILVKEYDIGGGERTKIDTEDLTLTAFATQDETRTGNRISLVVDLELPPKMHVYAPEVKGYRPVSIAVDENPYLRAHPAELPEPKMLHLEAINETVPVYEGRIRIFQDVTISPRLREPQVEISATLYYQACDDKICYPPMDVPLRFVLKVSRHDSQRSPESLQRKGKRSNP